MSREKRSGKKHIGLIIVILLVLAAIGSFLPEREKETEKPSPENIEERQEESADSQVSDEETGSDEQAASDDKSGVDEAQFTLTMLDVGQGLSILISANDHHMLYDGGGRESSRFVVSYLKKHGITVLDYMVASHYDVDHISGLIGVLNTTPVERVLLPDYTATTQTYTSLIRKIKNTETPYEYPEVGDTYSLGKAKFQIVSPADYDNDAENDNSIALRISCGDVSCIMTGDASEEAEAQMIASGLTIRSDVYIAGHHGSSASSSDAFLKAVSPDCVLISVGSDNKYGHPTQRVLSSLKKRKIKMFRTDKQSTVTMTSDGKTYWFDTDPCDDWSAGDVPENADASQEDLSKNAGSSSAGEQADKKDAPVRTYVLNIHTKKYHTPDCPSVSMMNEENKKTVETTRDQLLKDDYTPCGNCRPD